MSDITETSILQILQNEQNVESESTRVVTKKRSYIRRVPYVPKSKNACSYGSCRKDKAADKYCINHQNVKNTISKRLRYTKCIHEECTLNAYYGMAGTTKSKFCRKHSPDDYVNLISPMCQSIGCKKHATYKQESGSPEFCFGHAPKNYVIVNKKNNCLHLNCRTVATYGPVGTREIKYCAPHAPAGYISTRSKKCIIQGCSIGASYRKDQFSTLEYCARHCPIGAISKNKRIRTATEHEFLRINGDHRHHLVTSVSDDDIQVLSIIVNSPTNLSMSSNVSVASTASNSFGSSSSSSSSASVSE
jgi:hypothetical protein